MRFSSTCLLCDSDLMPIKTGPYAGYQKHPDVDFCLVRTTDNWGIAVTNPQPRETDDDRLDRVETDLRLFPFVEEVLIDFFKRKNLRRLGGVSSGKGWSSYAVYQRCPHAYRRRYLDAPTPSLFTNTIESPSLAIGTIVHTFLAIYYTRMIDPDYPVSVEEVRAELLQKADPKLVNEGYRVFYAYVIFYQNDTFQPLAIEKDLKDPRTGQSCRFDLIAFLPENEGPLIAGTYIIEHKTASRFDQDTLEGWANDGEVLGQVMLWQDLGLDNRYGPLRGVLVNLLGKQQEPKFHRTLVAPESWMMDGHRDDLRRYDGLIQLSKSSNSWPRARNNCINRFGRCSYWIECATENK